MGQTSGMPHAGLYGPITMESLLYRLGLLRAADVMEYLGRKQVAEEYRERAESLKKAVNTFCTDEEGMYLDGPGVKEYSQHCQVFALLTDTVTVENGRIYLERTHFRQRNLRPVFRSHGVLSVPCSGKSRYL